MLEEVLISCSINMSREVFQTTSPRGEFCNVKEKEAKSQANAI